MGIGPHSPRAPRKYIIILQRPAAYINAYYKYVRYFRIVVSPSRKRFARVQYIYRLFRCQRNATIRKLIFY